MTTHELTCRQLGKAGKQEEKGRQKEDKERKKEGKEAFLPSFFLSLS